MISQVHLEDCYQLINFNWTYNKINNIKNDRITVRFFQPTSSVTKWCALKCTTSVEYCTVRSMRDYMGRTISFSQENKTPKFPKSLTLCYYLSLKDRKVGVAAKTRHLLDNIDWKIKTTCGRLTRPVRKGLWKWCTLAVRYIKMRPEYRVNVLWMIS